MSVFTDQSNHANGLWWIGGGPGSTGTLLAYVLDGALVRHEAGTGERVVLTDQFEGK